jgi:DNA-binding LacI/PurR family transcriptional regulator
MATIKDVARLAESSITTVSRVINNTGYVKQETREKILYAIKALHYQPLERSSGLKSTQTLGLIVPNIENPFFGKMAKHLSSVANAFNYNILLVNIDEGQKTAGDFLHDLITNRVEGIIYASSYKNMEVIQTAQSKQVPLIVLDREITHVRINSVTVNNNYGAFIATEHLIKLGHRRVAFIGGATGMEISTRRKEGYLRALKEYGLTANEAFIGYGDYTMQSGFECMAGLYQAHPEITGVIAANDLMAIGAIHFLNKNGIHVAGDISVIGFDNIELAVNLTPALTTVEYPMEQMSERVIELLLRQIRNQDEQVEAVTLFPKLIIRESCSAVKGEKA